MNKLKDNLGSVIALFSGLTMLGAIQLWAPICQRQLDLYWKNGDYKQVHMNCFYTEKAVIYLSIILIALALAALFKGQKIVLAPILVGIFLYLSTSRGDFGIGLCKPGPDMECTITRVWIFSMAALSILGGIINYMNRDR